MTYPALNSLKSTRRYKEGKRHSRGDFASASGDVYQGEWLDDKMHGRAKMEYADGDLYVGQYEVPARPCTRHVHTRIGPPLVASTLRRPG